MTKFAARRTPRFGTRAGWNAILGKQPAPEPLEHDILADFTIVGGGFAGLSAARRLRQLESTASIVVLDALPIAESTSGRNSGFMIDLPHDLASDDYAGQGTAQDRAMIQLNRQAIAFAQSAAQEHEIAPAFVDPVGKINGAATALGGAHNSSYAAHLANLGETCEPLDAQHMREVTGSSHYLSGLYTPGTLMLQPAGYMRGLANGLRTQGVQIYENSPVLEFIRSSGNWRVKTPKGTVVTEKIILANNGHLESFGIAKGRLLQLFLYASMTPELTKEQLKTLGGTSRWGVTPADPMGTTMRRIDTAQGGNRIITRTCANVRRCLETSPQDVDKAARVQRRKFAERFEQLASVKMEFEWSGHLCLTLNGVSVTQEIDDGVFSACAQNGLGTARGTLTGIAAAEMACGVSSSITTHFMQEDPPKKLPPQPFAQIGANAYLRWKEWRAGKE